MQQSKQPVRFFLKSAAENCRLIAIAIPDLAYTHQIVHIGNGKTHSLIEALTVGSDLQKAHAIISEQREMNAALLSKLREIAEECVGCNGRGKRTVHGTRRGLDYTREERCEDCADIREVIDKYAQSDASAEPK